MSKFTLDTAIKYCLEVAEQNEKKAEYRPRMDYYDEIESRADCLECATEHRQLAEWLTELKEAKQLLKSAIDEWHIVCKWGNCGEYCGWFKNGKCTQEWSGKDEALKLLEKNDNIGGAKE